MVILVTGGTGYIGSHTCVELLNAGYEVVIVDNLSNSSAIALDRIVQITGSKFEFYQMDIRDRAGLRKVFQRYDIAAVVHFAGLKAVGDSVMKPLHYYQNNVEGTLILCDVMEQYAVRNIVFSSSATVYGDPASVPILESFPLSATNPYGRSKLFIEKILQDLAIAEKRWNIALLRYFNPVGAHETGSIGEDPMDIPNNLLPYIAQVAIGKLERLSIFGNDYDTVDGTGVRDYIHVVDLAKGHIQALKKLTQKPGVVSYNLGTGEGYSVLQVIAAFEKASGQKINYQIVARRTGDVAVCFADPSLAARELDWYALKSLDEMMVDAWRWQKNNPDGYV